MRLACARFAVAASTVSTLLRFDADHSIGFNEQLRQILTIVEHLIDVAVVMPHPDANVDVVVGQIHIVRLASVKERVGSGRT